MPSKLVKYNKYKHKKSKWITFTINIGMRKQVDISLEIPTEEQKFCETGLGR